MKQVLSINGGGVKGIGAIRILHLMNRDGITPYSFYDAFAGTSTGAIIASALAIGAETFDIVDTYKRLSKSIFKQKNIIPLQSKYKSKNLEKALKEYFGDLTFGDLEKPLYLGYYDFVKNQPRVFDRIGNLDMPLWKAVLISCSAPTYFPPVDRRYADGGLILQNPSLVCAVGYMRECIIPMNEIYITSIDTDGHKGDRKKLPKNPMVWDWLPRLVDTSLTGSESIMDFFCENLPFGGYLYLSPKIDENYPMDDVRIMSEYEDIWHSYYQHNRDVILNQLQGSKNEL